MNITAQHFKTVRCPLCQKPKRCLVNEEDGTTTKIKCDDCNITFQRTGPGKWKIGRG